MARSYSTKLIALTLDVQPKWLDNLLTRYAFAGVDRSRQGVERRITDVGVLAIEVCRCLNVELGLPVERAAVIAAHAVRADAGEVYVHRSGSDLALHIPLAVMRARLRAQLAEAIQSIPFTRRGRPPRIPDDRDVA